MLDRREGILFEIRPENERAIASIAGSRSLDAASQEYLFGLDRATPIAFHCHHRIRSQEAAQQLLREGFWNVYDVKGGVGVLNLYVAFNYSTDTWVSFKLFGLMGITLAFTLAIGIWLARHTKAADGA